MSCLSLPWFGGQPHWSDRIATNTPLRAVYEDPTFVHAYGNLRMLSSKVYGQCCGASLE